MPSATPASRSARAIASGRPTGARAARHRDLRRLPARDLRSRRSPLPLSLHQLHQLRSALQHHRGAAVRPRAHLDARLRDVPGVPGRVRRPARPPLPRAAERLPGVRPAAGALGRDRPRAGRDGRGAARARPTRICARAGSSRSRASAVFTAWSMRATTTRSARLRARKQREEKPFALMFPTWPTSSGTATCRARRGALLTSPEAPIVLLRAARADAVARGRRRAGQSVPRRDAAVHAAAPSAAARRGPARRGDERQPARTSRSASTSARRSTGWRRSPTVPGPRPADRPPRRRFDRPRRCSGARWSCAARAATRRCRCRARADAPPVLAVGAHLKNTVAVDGRERTSFVSQHIGDLETTEADGSVRARRLTASSSSTASRPAVVASDLHPRLPLDQARARRSACRSSRVQHHHAHVAACMAENELTARCSAWRGTAPATAPTGRSGAASSCCRRPARSTPGRDSAPVPPAGRRAGRSASRGDRRSALLHAIGGRRGRGWTPVDAGFPRRARACCCRCAGARPERAGDDQRRPAVRRRGVALSGLPQRASFEGQAAMELEVAARSGRPRPLRRSRCRGCRAGSLSARWQTPAFVVDWAPTIREHPRATCRGSAGVGACRPAFTRRSWRRSSPSRRVSVSAAVVLTGGCFQNRLLTERAVPRLARRGLPPVLAPARSRRTTAASRSARSPSCGRADGQRARRSRRSDGLGVTGSRCSRLRRETSCVSRFPADPQHRRRGSRAAQRPRGLRRHRQGGQSGLRARGDVGDYVLVHVGFAISTVDEAEAARSSSTCARWASSANSTMEKRREVRRRIPRRGGRDGATRARMRAHHDAAVDAHGGLRRADARDRQVRHRRAAAGGRHARPRPRLPGLRHAARADRQGDRDRRAPGVIFCSFGDMLRVPGPQRATCSRQGRAAATCASSTRRSTRWRSRARHPDREVVFFAVGFETTAPANAMAVYRPRRAGRAELLDARVARAGAAGDGGDPVVAGATACRASWPPATSAR